MAGGSRPKRALTAKATCPAGTIGAAGAAAGGGGAGGGGPTTPPGVARFAPGGVMGVGVARARTLGKRAGGIGAARPGSKPPVDCAEVAPDQASAKMPATAAKRRTPRPEIPDPTAIVAVLSNEIAAISSHKRHPDSSRWRGKSVTDSCVHILDTGA